MNYIISYIANSFVWSSIAKVLNATLKFITIPLLIGYFGKENYGILTLAIATNAYMQLLNMGMNTGAVKFFAQWIAIDDYERINRVARTNLTFYISLGIINCIVLLVLAWNGDSIFGITSEELLTFSHLLYILAGLSIINWTTFVFNQLLVANEKIAYTQQVLSVRYILNLILVVLTINYEWSIISYFLFDSLLNIAVIVPYYWMSKKQKLIRSILPGFFWNDFSVVLKYSLAIFAMSIFQITATQSRPLILGMFSDQGVAILTDYQVLEVFPVFIISIGGMLISILLPKTSKAIQSNDRRTIEKLAYTGTKYTSILVAILCFPIMLNTKDLLNIYVGESYTQLGNWLILWIFTVILFLHNTPIASLVLATGKTKILVVSSAISCIISILINALLTKRFGVGSAVIGYFVYIIIQMSFYYLYFNKKVLRLVSLSVFKSFIIPILIGLVSFFISYPVNFDYLPVIISILIKSIIWFLLYTFLLIAFKIIKLDILLSKIRNYYYEYFRKNIEI